MTTQVINATEYRDVPLAALFESATNPRRHFDESFLKGLADSIRANGVLSPLLVRPKNDHLEIVFGAQRYRAAQMADAATVPVSIREMTDAQVLEAQLVENLQRRDVHPMEEAQGLRALLELEEPKYSIEQIAAKTGKSAVYCAARLKLTELAPAVADAFWKDEIGVGHALLLAKLQTAQQESAIAACFKEDWTSGERKPKRILLPVRHLQQWIEQNVMLILKDAPFDRKDAELVPAAGSCVDCPKRTGHNTLLFAGVISNDADACSDPACWSAKLDAHVRKTVASKPKLVQITTAYGKPAEGSAVVPRNQYVEIRQEKPKNKYQQDAPEYKSCKFASEAIVADGTDKGEIRKVCANPDCPVHHPKKQQRRADPDTATKAAQEKQRREEAIANTTGIRVLSAIAEAVPVRLMKRDLLFVVERLAGLVDERRLEVVARQHGIKREKDSDSIAKLLVAYLRRTEENVLGSVLVELAILLTLARQQAAQVLNESAAFYKVDTDAIAAKVKQEFAAKDKVKATKKNAPKPPAKQQAKATKKQAAA
jgi:ParB family transcriptional regulator, chromosome partitioning protein